MKKHEKTVNGRKLQLSRLTLSNLLTPVRTNHIKGKGGDGNIVNLDCLSGVGGACVISRPTGTVRTQ
jgi:hypothetical protein